MIEPPNHVAWPGPAVAWRTATNLFMLAGAGSLAWSAAIHLDVWRSGYRSIPTIGPLFLFQIVTGFVLAVVVAGFRRLVPAMVGAVFLASTIGGLVLSVEVGLFGFRDSFRSPFATLSVVVEGTGIVVLSTACILRVAQTRRARAKSVAS